jgi:hypothetical protein
MIHLSNIHELVKNAEFSMKFVKSDGSEVYAEKCVCTSFFSRGRTLNVMFIDSNEVRKIRRCTIIEYNGEEVFL